MKVKEPVNRVAVEQRKWDDREARFKEIFKSYPKATQSRAFQIEKLKFYEEVSRKYKNSPNQDERLAARFLAEQSADLERNLYQSRTVRFLRSAFNAVDNLFKSAEKTLQIPTKAPLKPKMSATLSKNLVRAGFGSLVEQVSEGIKRGDNDILIRTAQYHQPGEKTSYDIGVKKDGLGNYHFLGFKASIADKANPGESVSQKYYFQQDQKISAKRAYNELEGRPVSVTYSSGQEKRTSMVTLDFNDKDPGGNYRRKEFPMDNFDWKKEIAKLPLKEMGQALLSKIEAGLMDGNREKVTFAKAGHEHVFYLQASPMDKKIVITDDNQNKLTIKEAILKTENPSMKVETPDQGNKSKSQLNGQKQAEMTFTKSNPTKIVAQKSSNINLTKRKRSRGVA